MMRPTVRTVGLSLGVLAYLLASGCTTLPSSTTPVLFPDRTASGSISGGESRTLAIDLEADSFLQLYVRQHDLDLRVVLLAPSGQTVATADGPGGEHGSEVLVTTTPSTGRHLLIITALDATGTGSFDIGVLELRPANDDDEERIAGLRAYADASQLYARSAPTERRRKALDLYAEAIRHFRLIDDTSNIGWALIQSARIQISLEAWQEALAAAREAVEIFQRSGDEDAYVAAVSNLARAQEGVADFDAALRSYDTTIDFYLQHIDEASEAATLARLRGHLAIDLNNRGKLYGVQGHFDRAETDYLAARDLWRRTGNTDHEITAILNLGTIYRQQGELERALEVYEDGRALVSDTGSRGNEIHLLSNLGRYYMSTGELDKASTALNRGWELAQDIGDTSFLQPISRNLGLLYELLGDPETAMLWFGRSLELSRAIGTPALLARSLLDIGRNNAGLGHTKESLSMFREAVEAARRAESVPLEVAARREMAATLAERGDLGDALATIDDLRARLPSVPEALRSAVFRTEARILQHQGDPRRALDVLTASLKLDLAFQERFERGAVLVQLADIERSLERFESALKHLEAAIELHEEIRARVTTPELRASFLARRRDHYLQLVDLLMELEVQEPGRGHAARALAVSERSRARTLVELLTEAKVEVERGVDPYLIQRERELLTRLSLLQGELLRGPESGEDPADRRESLEVALRQATESYRLIEEEIRRTSSSYSSLRYPETATLDLIQALLPHDGSMLHYVLGPDRSFLFVIQPGSFDFFVLPEREAVASQVEVVRKLVRRSDPQARVHLRTASRTLYDQLLAPAETVLPDLPRLLIVPDGELFYLPFELIQQGSIHLAPRVISYVPSATVLSVLESRSPVTRRPSLVAFAGPSGSLVVSEQQSKDRAAPVRALPGTVREVQSIAGLFPDASTLYIGESAHQGNLFDNSLVTHARWLHFASHGLIREDAPLLSSILLSPDQHGDSLLQTAEVFNLELHADIVVLSACETGLGRSVRGEGLIGLSRAFFYAGSANLVVSLWPVDDAATAELMHAFYVRLRGGESPARALHEARLQLKKEGPYRSPTFWAPFILLGRGG